MKTVLKLAVVALAVVGLNVGFMQSRASADTYCETGYVCLYDGANYTGSVLRMSPPGPASCRDVPYAWADNMADSFWNATNVDIYVYNAYSCGGAAMTIVSPHSGVPNFYSDSNKLSSIRRVDF